MNYKKVNPHELNERVHSRLEYFNQNPRSKKTMESITVFEMQKFIIFQMEQENGHVLCEAFTENLKLFSDLFELEKEKYYGQVVQLLCDVLILPDILNEEFLERVTTFWLNEMVNFSMAIKKRVFNAHFKKFKAIARNIPKLGCLELQSQVLKILYAHMDNPKKFIQKLFGDVIDESHWILKEIKSIEKYNNDQKHRLLNHDLLNCIIGKNIRSNEIQALHFDDKAVIPYLPDDPFSVWDLDTKSVEFAVTQELKAKIEAQSLQSLEFKILQKTQTVEQVTFHLRKALSWICDKSLNQKHNFGKVKKVDMTLTHHVDAHQLYILCSEMFPQIHVSVNLVKEDEPELANIDWDGKSNRIVMSTPDEVYDKIEANPERGPWFKVVTDVEMDANVEPMGSDLNTVILTKTEKTKKDIMEFFEPSYYDRVNPTKNSTKAIDKCINSTTPPEPIAEKTTTDDRLSDNKTTTTQKDVKEEKGNKGSKKTRGTKRKLDEFPKPIIVMHEDVIIVPIDDANIQRPLVKPPVKRKPIVIDEEPIDVDNYVATKRETCSSRKTRSAFAKNNIKPTELLSAQTKRIVTPKCSPVQIDELSISEFGRKLTDTTSTRETRSTSAKKRVNVTELTDLQQTRRKSVRLHTKNVVQSKVKEESDGNERGKYNNRRKSNLASSVLPSKRHRTYSSSDSDEFIVETNERQNIGEQFDSLLIGPCSFKGKVAKDAKVLEQKYSKELKQKKPILFSDDSS